MKSKPNIDAFLEGGATEKTSKAGAAQPAAAPEFRKQMVMQLPIGLINDLKRRALELSVRTGRRITQQQLVEEALRKFLYR
jgi:hypothetical protein